MMYVEERMFKVEVYKMPVVSLLLLSLSQNQKRRAERHSHANHCMRRPSHLFAERDNAIITFVQMSVVSLYALASSHQSIVIIPCSPNTPLLSSVNHLEVSMHRPSLDVSSNMAALRNHAPRAGCTRCNALKRSAVVDVADSELRAAAADDLAWCWA